MKSMKKMVFCGTSRIGERGQVVIPKTARENQFKPGDEVIFIGCGENKLIMLKASALDTWLEGFSESLKEIKRLSKK